MIIRDKEELQILENGGKKLAAILLELAHEVRPGIATKFIGQLAERHIKDVGGTPVFKGYQGSHDITPYPSSVCVSINEEVVHGIPGNRVIQDGDIVSIDLGMRYPSNESGLIVDSAITVIAGVGSQISQKLLNTTRDALAVAVSKVKAGVHVGDIGYAVEQFVKKNGFEVVRELVGHGVGHAIHEDPEIPNWGQKGLGPKFVEGQVIAIEPMVVVGDSKIELLSDGWTWVTADKSLAAHFEHTIVVTKTGAKILTEIY